MVDRVLKGLTSCMGSPECHECPYEGRVECIDNMLRDALELLKNKPNAPEKNMTYYRLMEIKNELETENENLKADVKELRRLTESLTNLCENLLKRIAADERS